MKQENSIDEKTTDWRLVLAALVVLPLILAFGLNLLLGVYRENADADQVFTQLGLPAVQLEEQQGYSFGSMYFCRFRVAPDSLPKFMLGLEPFAPYQGKPKEPVSFKLKREWWDLDKSEAGKGWDRGPVHLWRSDKQPDLFFGVVVQGESAPAGEEPAATKSDK